MHKFARFRVEFYTKAGVRVMLSDADTGYSVGNFVVVALCMYAECVESSLLWIKTQDELNLNG